MALCVCLILKHAALQAPSLTSTSVISSKRNVLQVIFIPSTPSAVLNYVELGLRRKKPERRRPW